MSLNINNKSSLVNNSNEEFSYFTLNKKVFNELILIPRPKNTLFQIMVHLACKVKGGGPTGERESAHWTVGRGCSLPEQLLEQLHQ